METIKVQCPAKINLNLKILNKREDGFHNIDSIMQTISLYDYLTISAKKSDRTEIKLSGTSDEIPYNEKNLVYKAAVLFLEQAGFCADIEIFIEKNIPVAAGLAGGSTDAAGTLFGLNEVFARPLSRKELHGLCAALGSDLNLCLEGGRQKTSGRGEILEQLPFEEFSVSLIKPENLGISAKEAYTKFAEKKNTLPLREGRNPLYSQDKFNQNIISGFRGGENNTENSPYPPPDLPLKGGGVASLKQYNNGRKYSLNAKFKAKQLRQAMTDAENTLWLHLQKKQFHNLKFRRQQPIGIYIADFVCFEKKLIIELDGGQHNEINNIKHDNKRDEFLQSQGFTVVRLWNNDIFENIDGVLEYLEQVIFNHSPKLDISTNPQGEGKDNNPLLLNEQQGGGLIQSREDFLNDLEWAVIDDYKELQTIKNKYPASVMSGSGSTYFLIDGEFLPADGFWVKNNLKSIPYGVRIV